MNETDPTAKDQEHLKLLSIFHYVLGAMLYLFGFFPIIHLTIGILFLTGVIQPESPDEEFPAQLFGLLFTILPLLLMAGAWTLATLVIIAGRKLARRISYNYCFVIACIECLFAPMGTVLGVFSILVLNRPSVRALFGRSTSYE